MATKSCDEQVQDIIASQHSLQRKCERWILFIKTKFQSRLLHFNYLTDYYITLTEPRNGDFFIWMYDQTKDFTGFGILCSPSVFYMEVRLIRRVKDDNGYKNVRYIAKENGMCSVFGKDQNRMLENESEIVPFIDEIGHLLSRMEPDMFLELHVDT